MTRSRRWAGAAAAALAVGMTTGCGVFSAQTTDLQYTPSDGAQGDLGNLAVRNLMFVAEDAESPGSLVGVFLNAGTEDLSVSLSSENGVDATFDVPAGGSIALGPDGDETVEVDPVDVVPGRTVAVTVDGDSQTLELVTPVLDGAIPDYADLVPSGTSTS